MSLPVKRQHEETTPVAAAAVEGKPQQQQHVGGVSGMVMEPATVFGGAESRPAKVARHNDQEKLEIFSITSYSKPGRDEAEPGTVARWTGPL